MPAEIFGRDAELQRIRSFIGSLSRSAAALVLAGPDGAGKTTLLETGTAMGCQGKLTVLETTPAKGACSQKVPPVAWEQIIRASGPVTLK